MVSTLIAWDCYPTSVTKGFPRAWASRSGAYSSTLLHH